MNLPAGLLGAAAAFMLYVGGTLFAAMPQLRRWVREVEKLKPGDPNFWTQAAKCDEACVRYDRWCDDWAPWLRTVEGRTAAQRATNRPVITP